MTELEAALGPLGAIIDRELQRIVGDVVRTEVEKLLSERLPDSLMPASSGNDRRAAMAGVDPEFTDAEIAKLLDLSADRVAKLRRAGQIGFYRYPKSPRIGASHLRTYQESVEVKPRRRPEKTLKNRGRAESA